GRGRGAGRRRGSGGRRRARRRRRGRRRHRVGEGDGGEGVGGREVVLVHADVQNTGIGGVAGDGGRRRQERARPCVDGVSGVGVAALVVGVGGTVERHAVAGRVVRRWVVDRSGALLDLDCVVGGEPRSRHGHGLAVGQPGGRCDGGGGSGGGQGGGGRAGDGDDGEGQAEHGHTGQLQGATGLGGMGVHGASSRTRVRGPPEWRTSGMTGAPASPVRVAGVHARPSQSRSAASDRGSRYHPGAGKATGTAMGVVAGTATGRAAGAAMWPARAGRRDVLSRSRASAGIPIATPTRPHGVRRVVARAVAAVPNGSIRTTAREVPYDRAGNRTGTRKMRAAFTARSPTAGADTKPSGLAPRPDVTSTGGSCRATPPVFVTR